MIPPPGGKKGQCPQNIGIDLGHVMQGLEDDAVTKFEDAWREWNT